MIIPFLVLSAACLAAVPVFLALEFAALRPGRAALSCALAVCAVWLALSVSVPVRGGYDNEHDFDMLSIDLLTAPGPGAASFRKELSPLVADAAWDLVSRHSLGAVLWKNRLFTLASGAALGLAAYSLAGAFAGAAAAALYLFNFLLILNSSTMASTAVNLFFFASAVCSVSFYSLRGKPRYFYWSLAALWLLFAARTELALFPLAVFLVLWLVFSFRRLRAGPPGRALAAEFFFMAVFLACLAFWALRLQSVTRYNGPSPEEMLRWIGHLEYQLGDANLAAAAHFLKGRTAALAAAAGLAGILLPWALPSGSGSLRRSSAAFVLVLWLVYMAVFFACTGEYPLHFMRHQAYFFLPAALLFAFASGQAAGLAGRRRWFIVPVCALFLAYAALNYRQARALDGELRTNDLEWQVLLEAARGLPRGCAVVYPDFNDSRHALLGKYFRLAESGEALAGTCFVKYLSPLYQIAPADLPKTAQNYNPWAPGYVQAREEPLFGRVFPHRSYCTWAEPRAPRFIKTGFYPAATPRDRAWLLALKAGAGPAGGSAEAQKLLGEGAGLDPDCDLCRYGLAMRLALGGAATDAAVQLDYIVKAGMLRDKAPLACAIGDIALGNRAAAREEIDEFLGTGLGRGPFDAMALHAREALAAGEKGQVRPQR